VTSGRQRADAQAALSIASISPFPEDKADFEQKHLKEQICLNYFFCKTDLYQ
jgi:hypothetical protein